MPLVLGNMVRACARITRIGDKSFDFEYALIHTSDNSIAAIGTSVQVAYNYDTASSIPVPENWRHKMIAYEPALS
jgi:acyl-CoA thioester hydrolase